MSNYSLEMFLSTLFEPNEKTCYASSKFGTFVKRAPSTDDIFFSINAMEGSRADSSVVSFRNILIELDEMSIDEQKSYVSGIPHTSLVFSGSKSLHAIISLETPLAHIDDYRDIVARVHEKMKRIDHSTKNPSRLSRLPFRNRPDTGKMQELLWLGPRVNNKQLYDVLPILPKKQTVELRPTAPSRLFELIKEPDESIRLLKLSGRNQFFFWLGKRLEESKADISAREYMIQKAFDNLNDKTDFSLQEARAAARLTKGYYRD